MDIVIRNNYHKIIPSFNLQSDRISLRSFYDVAIFPISHPASDHNGSPWSSHRYNGQSPKGTWCLARSTVSGICNTLDRCISERGHDLRLLSQRGSSGFQINNSSPVLYNIRKHPKIRIFCSYFIQNRMRGAGFEPADSFETGP
jgi:hypothetical protein